MTRIGQRRWRRIARAVMGRQLVLDMARRPAGRGGWRPGAGRPRGRTTCSHATRPAFAPRDPVHVTVRIVRGLSSLRRGDVVRIVRESIAKAHREDFRVIHFSVLRDHLHLLVEAAGAPSLSRGMQGLNVRFAKRINARLGRRGALLAERYHGRPLRTPSEVRAVLRYVLLNARHHAAQRGRRLASHWVDPYSSGVWFGGWREPLRVDVPWIAALARLSRPTAMPRTWLLLGGWLRGGGPIPLDDIPGADEFGRDSPVTRGRAGPSSWGAADTGRRAAGPGGGAVIR